MEKLERGIEKHGKVIGFFIDLIYRLRKIFFKAAEFVRGL